MNPNPTLNLDKDMGTVTIDRRIVHVIPGTANNIDSFMEWFQNCEGVTAKHNAMMLGELQKTIVFPSTFWQGEYTQSVDPTPGIHPSLSDIPDGDRVDSVFCLKSIEAFAADGNIEQVTSWGLFAAKMLRDSETDVAYWRESSLRKQVEAA